ncbi:MAG: chitobiase/beta-hexosaminidase C-terminal domain-containing protein [Prevotella sp.]|nr:chitobiase/beta-hexosaminidase C-terminal domain-containing protein [Prevotella sp.]
MKKLFSLIVSTLATLSLSAQGWPAQYEGVMLQGFYWDSFSQSQWVKLEKQADELSQYFSLVWLPQSADCGGTSMGYDDLYWFPGHYNSSFGSEAELRSLIQTFKSKGIGTIADVVINHRKNVSNWVDFPKETYNGVTYELKSTDICGNDDGGATKQWAQQNGYTLGNNDTGEGWDGMRDLDHTSENVQTNVKAYLKMLLNDLGYTGFRYDMVKGYSASYTKMYNEDAQPQFSVGECWDGTNTIKNWIEGTGKTSAAFDFQFRYTVRNAANNGDWRKLIQQNDGNWPLISSSYNNGAYKQWAVTFVENHDTEKRSNAAQDPLKKDTLAANAYLLAMPGTPCVFFTHWIDCKQSIKAMIDVRRFAGIQNTGNYNMLQANNAKYAAFSSQGSKSNLLVVVGQTNMYTPEASWIKVLEGHHFAYYLDQNANTAWVDLASGEYEGTQKATLTAVTATAGAQLVYTTDGSTPTANSTKVASGTKIDITGNMTLKVGLLIGGTVSGIVTRTYTEPAPVVKTTINIYVNTDKVGWTAVNFWSWGGDDSHSPVNKNWPGDKVSTTTAIGGKQWYAKEFTINGSDDFVNLVFSTGSGSPQTIDINNVTTTKFYEVSTQKDGDKHLVTDVTGSYTDIREVRGNMADGSNDIYDLQGRKVTQMQRGIYIINGKKVVIK